MIKKFLILASLACGLVNAAEFTWYPITYSSAGLTNWPGTVLPGQYEIDNHGRVFLRGFVTCTVDPVDANITVFTLPLGYALLSMTIVPVVQDNGSINELQINTDGTVYLRSPFYCNQNVDFLGFEGANYSTK